MIRFLLCHFLSSLSSLPLSVLSYCLSHFRGHLFPLSPLFEHVLIHSIHSVTCCGAILFRMVLFLRRIPVPCGTYLLCCCDQQQQQQQQQQRAL